MNESILSCPPWLHHTPSSRAQGADMHQNLNFWKGLGNDRPGQWSLTSKSPSSTLWEFSSKPASKPSFPFIFCNASLYKGAFRVTFLPCILQQCSRVCLLHQNGKSLATVIIMPNRNTIFGRRQIFYQLCWIDVNSCANFVLVLD